MRDRRLARRQTGTVRRPRPGGDVESAAPNEVHDLDRVAFAQGRHLVLCTRDDFQVALHGNWAIREPQVDDQAAHAERARDGQIFAVDAQVHRLPFPHLAGSVKCGWSRLAPDPATAHRSSQVTSAAAQDARRNRRNPRERQKTGERRLNSIDGSRYTTELTACVRGEREFDDALGR